MSQNHFHTYILRCSDCSYYVGHSDQLEVRVTQHNSGDFGGWTKSRRPVVLLWSEAFASREDAFAAERRVKGWSRAKKEALMAGDWSLVSSLSRNRQP